MYFIALENFKMKRILSTAIYESASFMVGMMMGAVIGFMMAMFYIFLPWGVP